MLFDYYSIDDLQGRTFMFPSLCKGGTVHIDRAMGNTCCNEGSEACGSICNLALINLDRVKQAVINQQCQKYQRQGRDVNNTGQESGQAATQSEPDSASSWNGADSGADSANSWDGAGSGAASANSWDGAGSGADSANSWDRAGSGADSRSSWDGVGSGGSAET